MSHVLPYLVFAGLPLIAAWLPEAAVPWTDAARTVLTGALLAAFAVRGAYPELFGRRDERGSLTVGGAVACVLVGVVLGCVWVPLASAVPTLGERGGFAFDAPHEGVRLVARLVGSIVVVPLAEELAVRSFVPRLVDAGGVGEPDRDWRAVPVGRLSKAAFVVSLAVFVIAHPEWLSAIVFGVVALLALVRTRSLWSAVWIHVGANAALAVVVLWTRNGHWW